MGMGNTLMEIALTGPDMRLLCYVPIREPLLFVLSIALIPLLCCVYNIHIYSASVCVYSASYTVHAATVLCIYSASYTVHATTVLCVYTVQGIQYMPLLCCVYIQCKLYSTCHYCVVCIYSARYTVHTSFILLLQEHPPANPLHILYTHTHVLHYCWHKEISRKDPKWPTAIAFCTPQRALQHTCLCACHLILKPLMHLHTTPL